MWGSALLLLYGVKLFICKRIKEAAMKSNNKINNHGAGVVCVGEVQGGVRRGDSRRLTSARRALQISGHKTRGIILFSVCFLFFLLSFLFVLFFC